MAGRWFGTFLIFPYIGNHDPKWKTLFFQRGSYTTNQKWVTIWQTFTSPWNITMVFMGIYPLIQLAHFQKIYFDKLPDGKSHKIPWATTIFLWFSYGFPMKNSQRLVNLSATSQHRQAFSRSIKWLGGKPTTGEAPPCNISIWIMIIMVGKDW